MPTLQQICEEALKKAGYTNIPADILTRATTEWIEELKADIQNYIDRNSSRLKSLLKTAYSTTIVGVHRYINPVDYGSDLTLSILDGVHDGEAQAGSVSSITLAVDEDVTEDYIVGKYIFIYEGTGVNSISQVFAYDATTKIAEVVPNFANAPASGSKYKVIETSYDLEEKNIVEFDKISVTGKSRPLVFYPIGSDTYGEFVLHPTPDKVYGMQMRYFVNLIKVDLTSQLMDTLYENWRNVWIQGIFAKALQNVEDVNTAREMKVFYEFMLPSLIAKESYGVDWGSYIQFSPFL